MFTPLQDIKLETVDFKWIQQATKISHLKRAIRLIQQDGNYFQELKDACYERIGQIDPLQKRIVIDNRPSLEQVEQLQKELSDWETNLIQKQDPHRIFENTGGEVEIDIESYFSKEPEKSNKKKLAQNEKNKGNQAIKSKDYDEAIKYYTNSIKYDGQIYQSYGNRALAYLKIKQFKKALEDCESAIRLNPNYTKAYHRKAKSLLGLKNRVQAYSTLQQALKIEPDNSECIAQLKDLRQEMTQPQKTALEGKSKFKKVIIEEDSDEEQQGEQIKQK